MADSLVLKGVKDVRKHTGSEMLLVRPKRGGDVHQIKRWWTPGTKSTVYAGCSLFKVTQAAGVVYLAIDSSEMSTIRVDLADDFDFKFFGIAQVERAALFDENMQLIEHYLFPKISGGKNVTVTPPGGASRPVGTTSISSVVVVGNPAPTQGTSNQYNAGVTATATPLTYSWSVVGGTITAGQGTGNITVNWTGTGAGSVTCDVSSTDPNFDGADASFTLPITIAASFATRVAGATFSYVVDINNIGTTELPQIVYTLNGVDGPGIAGSVGDTFAFDFSAVASTHPLGIFTDSTKTTPVTVGVTVEGDTLLFEPPIAGTFSYQCINHSNMGGDITIS